MLTLPATSALFQNIVVRASAKKQIIEILKRFNKMGIQRAEVTTGDNPFFLPARNMYQSCEFN